MDKEEARFILRCFRPDGADAENPDFAEALAWAAKDRELGDWLAHERATDAAFSRALGSLALPEALRDEILTALALQSGEPVILTGELDRAAMAALASVAPPLPLRSEVLAAMARTTRNTRPRRPWWSGWRLGLPLAAAAGVALAIILSSPPRHPAAGVGSATPFGKELPNPMTVPSLIPQAGPVPISTLSLGTVEKNCIMTLESPAVAQDPEHKDGSFPFDHVNPGQKLPCPSTRLPEGLRNIPGVGFRDLAFGGKKGVMVCYKDEGKMVHLAVFKRCDVMMCPLPERDHPDFAKDGQWSIARWADKDWVYMLLGGQDVDQEGLQKLF